MFSKEELRTAALVHMQLEHDVKVDQLMDTVSAHPVWWIEPVFRIEGRSALAELYRRVLPESGHKEMAVESMAALDDPEVTKWGDFHFVTEFSAAQGRYPLHKGMALVVHFDGLLLASERVYVTDLEATKKLREVLRAGLRNAARCA
jgi:hypothetical protein